MRRNPLQFAIVREDPEVELALLPKDAGAALLVASGGCTALAVGALRPDVDLTLVDPNPAQLALVREKLAALRAHPPGSAARARAFGVGVDDPSSLAQRGNFEALFRAQRAFLDALSLPHDARRRVLLDGDDVDAMIGDPYWPVSFEMFFCDPLLETMFGPAATQHAVRGSYPGYFRAAYERGLRRPDRATNPFLHHLLLGFWVESALPTYVQAPAPPRDPALLQATLLEAPRFDRFDLISLSNVLDWSDVREIEALSRRLVDECRPGTVVVARQLNNAAPIEEGLSPAFRFDHARAADLHARDRSLFYERLLVAVKT